MKRRRGPRNVPIALFTNTLLQLMRFARIYYASGRVYFSKINEFKIWKPLISDRHRARARARG